LIFSHVKNQLLILCKITIITLMDTLLEKIEQIVTEAGNRLLNAPAPDIFEKEGVGNYVTNQDLDTQKFLYEKLAELLPDAVFVGEEDEASSRVPEKGYCFVIDPIDGTSNFIRKANYSSISVGLLKDGAPEIGIVLNPFTGELYKARRGGGAFLNGRPIRVSEKDFQNGVCVVGFSTYERGGEDRQFKMYQNLFTHCEDLRCLGSAALDICGVACGRWEVFTELILKPWDYAAGLCILTEAGGILTAADGSPVAFQGKSSILAASRKCYAKALELLSEP